MNHSELISRMTTEEKASLMSGQNYWNTKAVKRLHIPSMMLTDGPHGLRKQGGKADHLGLHQSLPATCFPTAAGLANTWDEALLEDMGRHLGLEAAKEQVSVLLGPGCNIKRNPLCGRNFEYFSEDPFLSGKAAAALIRGIQENGIAACVKHFAVNSQEHCRMTSDSVLDERTLRELYLPAFELAVKEGNVKCLMSAYNKVNGTYANENEHLLRDILRDEWGFQGMVVTDWGGNNDRVVAVKAGCALEMPATHGETDQQIVEAVREGRLDERELDERVDELLTLLFDVRPALQGKTCDMHAQHAAAARVALQTAVLLKNEDDLLPLKQGQRVAVIGSFAARPRYQGAGSSRINPWRLDDLLDALKAEGVHVTGYAEGFRRGGKADPHLLREAVRLAADADVALVCLGLDEGGEAEGLDRADMRLPENQLALLRAVAAANPNVAVTLSCGCAVEMAWDKHAKAVMHGYLGGQAGAIAMAALLAGRETPSGKLAETVPLECADAPSAHDYPGHEATAEYREGIFVGYRYYDTAKIPVKHPFGFGLSYTRFAYADLVVDGDTVSFTVENTGSIAGAEVSQLYIRARTGGMFRPEKELKGFARTPLAPGEKKRVTLRLDARSYAVWSIIENDWVMESGAYDILVGASSADIRLQASVTKEAPPVENPYADAAFAPYYRAAVQTVPDESFAALLGRPIPPHLWDRAKPLSFNDAVMQGSYLPGGLGRTIYRLAKFCRGAMLRLGKKPLANNVMFVMNMPYRGIARLSGLFSDAEMYALLKVVNREKGGWRAFFAAKKEKKRRVADGKA